jgi:hypothetical protein
MAAEALQQPLVEGMRSGVPSRSNALTRHVSRGPDRDANGEDEPAGLREKCVPKSWALP